MHPHIDNWTFSHRTNEYLFTGVKEELFSDVAASKGRNAGEQFAHIYNVRLLWVKESAPNLLPGLLKVEKEQAITKKILLDAFAKSKAAIADLLRRGFDTGRCREISAKP